MFLKYLLISRANKRGMFRHKRNLGLFFPLLFFPPFFLSPFSLPFPPVFSGGGCKFHQADEYSVFIGLECRMT
jgi:hypothetical protein